MAFVMNGSGDEFDLAVFKISRGERVACHLFDNRSICEKIFLANAFVGSSVCRTQRCRASPFAI
jgi:hypothetical protein